MEVKLNPVPVLPVVKVIRGMKTSNETTALTYDLAKRFGTTAVEAKDAPGFLADGMLMPMIDAVAPRGKGIFHYPANDPRLLWLSGLPHLYRLAVPSIRGNLPVWLTVWYSARARDAGVWGVWRGGHTPTRGHLREVPQFSRRLVDECRRLH